MVADAQQIYYSFVVAFKHCQLTEQNDARYQGKIDFIRFSQGL